MGAYLHETVTPRFKEVQRDIADSLHALRESNCSILQETTEMLSMQLCHNIKWKAELAENMRRFSEMARSDPQHPLNSKLRRKLLPVGGDD